MQVAALEDDIGHSGKEQTDRSQGIVVARHHEVDTVRITVGVDDGHDRNVELHRLVHRDVLAPDVENKEGIGNPLHVLDALEVPEELELLAPQLDAFLLGHQTHAAVFFHRLNVLQAGHTLADGLEVGQQTA